MAWKDLEARRAGYKRYLARLTPEERAQRLAATRRINAARYKDDPEFRAKVKAKARRWHSRNVKWLGFLTLLRKHGLTLDQYHAMHERQNFQCAICGCDEKLMLDHCHRTCCVRGLLCNRCNSGIGFLGDSPMVVHRALKYLDPDQLIAARTGETGPQMNV